MRYRASIVIVTKDIQVGVVLLKLFLKKVILPIRTEAYPTPTKFIEYSVLDRSKTTKLLGVETSFWRGSSQSALIRLSKINS